MKNKKTTVSRAVKKNTKVKNLKKNSLLARILKARVVLVALVVFGVSGTVLALLPDSAPVSLAKITGKNTDRTAPKLDTLEGNYSVSGEATSSSLLVKYKNTASDRARADVHKQYGAKVKRNIAPLGVDVVSIASTESVGELVRKYRSKAEVEYVEPNYLAKRFLTPDDSLFSKQWHLHKIGAPEAWDKSQGGFGPIAIIDTGIASSQSDLSGSVLPGYNFVSDNTDTNDDNGHGTHVAGIVSASTNNSNGVASIGFKGTLLPVKVLDGSGAGSYGDVASGIIYATDQGAKIINLSLGGSSSSRTLEDAIKYALARGVVIVAAAGNNGNDSAVYPAMYPGVVAVTATTQNDALASFSSYGNHTFISAPGEAIISTYHSGGYATLSGTSMAAPLVSGLIGLAISSGATTPHNVLNDLRASSDKVGAYAYDQNGWNQYFGYGRINATKLLGNIAVKSTESTTEEVSTAESASKPPHSTDRPSRANAPNPQFDTVIEGNVDSVDIERSVAIIKVNSSADNLRLNENNLVDLYISQDTLIRHGNSLYTLGDLRTGNKITVKATWKDNQLTAKEIQLTSKPNSKPTNKRSSKVLPQDIFAYSIRALGFL